MHRLNILQIGARRFANAHVSASSVFYRCVCLCLSLSVSVCLCSSLSVSVCLCLSLSVFVFLCVSVCFCVFLCVSVCESLPYTYCTHAKMCTMHVFWAFRWPFHCIHIAVTKAHAACRRPKSFVRRCTSETILTSADAACRRPVSFLRMMHHCIMPPWFQPKECPAIRVSLA